MLLPVMEQFASHPDLQRWRLHLFHGTANVAAAERVREHFLNERVVLSNLGVAGLTEKDVAYNRLLTSNSFWKEVASFWREDGQHRNSINICSGK